MNGVESSPCDPCLSEWREAKLDTPVFSLLRVRVRDDQEVGIFKGGSYQSEVFGTRIVYVFYFLPSASKLVEKTRFGTRMILRENCVLKLFLGR